MVTSAVSPSRVYDNCLNGYYNNGVLQLQVLQQQYRNVYDGKCNDIGLVYRAKHQLTMAEDNVADDQVCDAW